MINNKVLVGTFLVALASIFTISLYWNDFAGTLKVNVSMDRQLALESSKEAEKSFEILPKDLDQAVIYQFDSSLRNYVELKQGGRERFQNIIDNDVYSPYNWMVRSFKEGEIAELYVQFKPDGSPNGYVLKIPEDYKSNNLDEEEALNLVTSNINKHWSGKFEDYELIESSFMEMPNGRIDHTFVFEHKLKDIGDAKYRLSANVAGSIVSKVNPYAFVPESFKREFANIRSDNNTIAAFANYAFLGIYLLGIGLVTIILFYRNGWLKWKKSLTAAAVVAFTTMLVDLNFAPSSMMYYDTATSKSQFFTEQMLAVIANSVLNFLIIASSFIVAESSNPVIQCMTVYLEQQWLVFQRSQPLKSKNQKKKKIKKLMKKKVKYK